MAIVFVEGFDAYNGISSSTAGSMYHNYGFIGSAITLVSGRYGAQAARITSTSSSAGSLKKTINSSLTQGTIGFAIRFTTFPTNESNIHHCFTDSADDGIGIQYLANGAIRLISTTNGYTALGTYATTAAGVITLNAWHYIELEFTIANSGGVLNLYVDGVLVSSGTYDTLITSSSINTIQLGPALATNAIGVFLIDDLYVTDTSTRLGEQRVETLYPSADTAQKQWTPSTGSDNFALVDETLMNTTDYVIANTVGSYDLYEFGNLSSTANTISAITISALAEKDGTVTRALAMPVKSGSTTVDGPNNYLALGYTVSTRILETDPNTSTAWTASGVNSIQAGIKVTI